LHGGEDLIAVQQDLRARVRVRKERRVEVGKGGRGRSPRSASPGGLAEHAAQGELIDLELIDLGGHTLETAGSSGRLEIHGPFRTPAALKYPTAPLTP